MGVEYDVTINGQHYDAAVTYDMDDGLRDGTFVRLHDMQRFDKDMKALRPVRCVATRSAFDFLGDAGTIAVMEKYCDWYNRVRLTLPAEDRWFETRYNGKRIWVEEHGEGFSLYFPHER